MAVLVKPNGLLGHAYMAAIRPFRHVIVYPPMLRQIGRGVAGRAGLSCSLLQTTSATVSAAAAANALIVRTWLPGSQLA